MKTLVLIGDQWYRRDGFNLTPIDTPEKLPAEGTYIDGSALAAELDGLDFDAVTARTEELSAAYQDALDAQTKGEKGTATERLTAARQAQEPAIVAHFLRTQRKAALDDLGQLPEIDGKTPANPTDPAKNPEAKPAEAKPAEGTPAEGTPAGDGDAGGDEPIVVPDDLSGLPAGELATIAAAARIIVRERGGDPAAALAALMPGQAPKGGTVAASAPAAELRAAANLNVNAGAAMSDEELADCMQRFARSARGGRGAASQTLGHYLVFGGEPNMVAGAVKRGEQVAAGGELDIARGNWRKLPVDKRPRTVADANMVAGAGKNVAAAPARCGPADVRREIPDCGDMSSPLLDLLQTYPAPHCELEYYLDIPLAAVADGITVWDTAARTAFQDARDAWLAAVAADETGANLAAAFATMQAAQKGVATAGCAPTATVTMLPISAQLEYPTDLEYCSPQSIQAYRRALNRLFLRERTSNFLAVLETFTRTITVDASAAPFVNNDTVPVQVGASAVVDMVVSHLKPQGVMAERVTAGNYAVILPYGLQMGLELDGRLAEGMAAISSLFGGARVITTLDTATGTALPFSALPAVGSTTDFPDIMLPTDWDMHLVDLDDMFEISRPDIEVGAQITPETIKGNMVFGGFMESTAGYGKDGCHPAWTISLSNLLYNGVRPDRMQPGQFAGFAP